MKTTSKPILIAAVLALAACATPRTEAPTTPPAPSAPAAPAEPAIDWDAIAASVRNGSDDGASVEAQDGGGLRVTIADVDAFDSGAAQVKAGLARTLAGVAETLRAYPKLGVLILGHTDSVGREGFNMELSRRRAGAVRTHLIDIGGIAAERLVAEGRGEKEPLADNGTAEGRARNRRVELLLTPPR